MSRLPRIRSARGAAVSRAGGVPGGRPHLRDRGIGEYVSRHALERAHTMGHRRAVWLTAWWNTPAIRSANHPDYRYELGTVGYVNLRPGRRYFAIVGVHPAGDGIRLYPGPWPSPCPSDGP